MRKFARTVLILLLCALLGGAAGAVFTYVHDPAVYTSEAQLIVNTGDSEGMIRASDGGLKQDFAIVFRSAAVMDVVKEQLGTDENIADNLEVETPANSNIIILKYSSDTAQNAKTTVDLIAKTATRTTTIVPVSSITVFQEGTLPDKATHRFLLTNVRRGALIGGIGAFAILVLKALFSNAFHPRKEDEDKEVLYKDVLPRLKKLEQDKAQTNAFGNATKEAVAAAAAQIEPDDELVEYMRRHRRIHRSSDDDILAGADEADSLTDDDLSEEEEADIERAAKAAEAAETASLMNHAIQRHMAKAAAVANAAVTSPFTVEPDVLEGAGDSLYEEEEDALAEQTDEPAAGPAPAQEQRPVQPQSRPQAGATQNQPQAQAPQTSPAQPTVKAPQVQDQPVQVQQPAQAQSKPQARPSQASQAQSTTTPQSKAQPRQEKAQGTEATQKTVGTPKAQAQEPTGSSAEVLGIIRK